MYTFLKNLITLHLKLTLMVLLLASLAGYFSYSYVKGSTFFGTTITPRTTTLDDGLVGHWSFDGDTVTDKVYDLTSNNNDGHLSGVATSSAKVPGVLGQAFTFDGTDDFIDLTNSAGLSWTSTEKYTRSFWIRPNDFTEWSGLWYQGQNDSYYVIIYVHTTTDITFGPVTAGVSLGVCYYNGGNGCRMVHSRDNVLSASNWSNLTITYDGTQATDIDKFGIFVDGFDVTDRSDLYSSGTALDSGAGFTTNFVYIGRTSYAGEYIAGVVDDVRMYNRVLSNDEVFQLYKMGDGSTMGVNTGTNRLALGLAGYWPLDEGSGSSTRDSSVNPNHGTTTNMDVADWTTGKIGGALDFDGTNEYIDVGYQVELTGAEHKSWSAWFNRDTFTTDDVIISKITDTTSGVGNILWVDDAADDVRFMMRDGTDTYLIDSATTITATGWHHVAVVWDTTEVRMYLDGRLDVGGTSGTLGNIGDLDDPKSFHIGASDASEYFDGKLDDIRVYNRILTEDDVQQLYKLTAPTVVDTSLMGYWTFDGNDFDESVGVAEDLSGRDKGGSLNEYTNVASGKVGQAATFDGNNDYIIMDNEILTSATKTIVAWINPRSSGEGGFGQIVNTSNGGSGLWFSMCNADGVECPGANNTIELYQNFSGTDGVWYIPSSNIIPLNAWTQVALTYDASSVSNNPIFYINGHPAPVYEASTPTGARDADDIFYIGNNASAGAYTFDGKIDEVRAYNRILTADEIQKLYSESVGITTNTPTAAGIGGKNTLDSGLALYWKFDDASGSTTRDSSVNANHGTTVNMDVADWTTGQIGGALDFDGTNEYAYVLDPASGALDFADGKSFSVAGWFTWERTQLTDTIVAKKTIYSAAGQGYMVYANNGPLVFAVSDGTDDYVIESGTNVNDSAWHHFVAVWGDTYANLYIDGAPNNGGVTGTIGNVNSLANAVPFSVAIDSDADDIFDGRVDEIRVYNKALSADEVAKLYRTTLPTTVDTSLIGYWSFNGPDINGLTAYDRSGQGNDGTLSGTSAPVPNPVPGKVGQALDFNGGVNNGEGSYVELNSPASLDNVHTFTWSAWVKPGSLDMSTPIIEKGSGSSVLKTFFLGTTGGGYPNGVTIQVDTNGTDVYSYGINAYTVDEWAHWVVTYDNAGDRKGRIYKNGVEITYDTQTAGTGTITDESTTNFNIGATPDTTFLSANAAIDDVRMYNRILSAGEITELYNQSR